MFERTFAVVVDAIVRVGDGSQLKALFHKAEDQDADDIFAVNYYNPVDHSRSSTLVAFDEVTGMDKDTQIDEFKNRWYALLSL